MNDPRLTIEYLPPYAPELNPVEYLWLWRVAVGTRVAPSPPHRSVLAAFPHTAPTLGDWRRIAR
jgi:transposase